MFIGFCGGPLGLLVGEVCLVTVWLSATKPPHVVDCIVYAVQLYLPIHCRGPSFLNLVSRCLSIGRIAVFFLR